MSERSGHWDDFGMDTVSLAGPLEVKLRAIRDAGFSQVMLSVGDLVGHEGGVEAAIGIVRASGLRVTALQPLRDFEGLEGPLHAYKVDVAKWLIEACAAVEAPVLVASSSTLAHASADRDAIASDLRKLAMLAVPSGVKIAYVAVSSARTISDFGAALDVVDRADMPNLGIGIDSFQAIAAKSHLDELGMMLPETILLVQLSDFMTAELRVFPGEGLHSVELGELVRRLDALGHGGDYSFQVFNDDYRQMDPARVAQRARRCAIWLGEEVLHRAVPQPWASRLRRLATPAG